MSQSGDSATASSRSAALAPYLVATVLVGVCAGLRWLADPVLGPLARFPFVLAVAISTYLGGLRPGLFSIVLSTSAAVLLFVGDPLGIDERRDDQLNIVVFVVQSAGIVVLTDLMRRARNEARAAVARADAAAHAKDDFIARVSHEWRTPLNAIMGWVDQLRLRSDDREFVRRAAASMMRAAETQRRLIDDLLEYSRGSRGALSMRPARLLVSAPLAAAIDSVRDLAADKQIHLTVTLDESNPRVWGDAIRLRQLFSNLVVNAIKFTPSGGGITIRERQVGGAVEITVADTGAGIDASVLPRLFNPFEQGDPVRDAALGGVGLGLAIAREVAEGHGGTLTAASDGPGRGSTFTVQLPLAVAEADSRLNGTAA